MMNMMPKINIITLISCFYSSVRVLRRTKCIWTLDKIVQSPFPNESLPNMTVAEYIWKDLNKWSTKIAVVCGVTNRYYTYEQLHKQSLILGASLIKFFKVRDGDCVAIMLPNVPEFPIAFFGVLTVGGIATTINPAYTSNELKRQIELSQAKLLITQSTLVSVVKETLNLCQKDMPIIVTDSHNPNKTVSFLELLNNKHEDLSVLKNVKRGTNDVAILLFSSRTTGLPKGVELTNKNLVANCEQQNTECKQYAYTTDSHQDTVLMQLPMFHSYGLCAEMIHKLSVGLKLVTLPQLNPKIFLDTLIHYKINTLYLAPPSVQFLASSLEVTSKHFEHLTCITSGAAPLPLTNVHKLLESAGRDLYFTQGNGITETSPLISLGPPGFKDYTTVGFPLPNIELRIVNDRLKKCSWKNFKKNFERKIFLSINIHENTCLNSI